MVAASGDIYLQQGSLRGVLLQKAADGSHIVARRIERFRLAVSVGVAALGVLGVVARDLAAPIGVVGAGWTFLSFLVVARMNEREIRVAARIQEQFDVWVFGLPESIHTDGPVPDDELQLRARRSLLASDRMVGWYPDVGGLPDVYAVLACQRENLSRDWRLRRAYAGILEGSVAVWVISSLIVAALVDVSVRSVLVRWFVPSSSLVLLALERAREQRRAAGERERLAAVVNATLDTATPGGPPPAQGEALESLCRAIQDGIFNARARRARVPQWLYEFYRPRDEDVMDATVGALRHRLTGP